MLMPYRPGVGAATPEDLTDRLINRSKISSNNKLLEILGKKAANAHLASKQAPKPHTQPPKPAPKPPAKTRPAEESENDEEEGRSSAFRSKKQKMYTVPAK